MVAAFSFVDMHDLTDAVDAAFGVPGLAVPNPPAQPLDLLDDHRFRLHPTRVVGRQTACRLRRVLESHRDMEPIEDGWRRDAGTPTRTDRRPGQPSVKAVTTVASVRPTAPRFRWISAEMSVLAFATAPNTCRPPSLVSTFPTRTSKCRSPSSRLRMKVESTLTVIAAAIAVGPLAAAVPSCSPIRRV